MSGERVRIFGNASERAHWAEQERDAYFEELQQLRRLHVYTVVERDWYREACEEWLRHSHGCAADIGDEYKCKCGLRKWMAEDKRRRETVYKEEQR